jgi:hypothetical protein
MANFSREGRTSSYDVDSSAPKPDQRLIRQLKHPLLRWRMTAATAIALRYKKMEQALQMDAWDLSSSWLVKQPKWEVAVVKGGQRAGKAREKRPW